MIAVLRAESKEMALRTIDAVVQGGITGLEITFTIPDAESVIKETVSAYQNNSDIVIGAGTVLDVITARIAIMSGAEFIVSPAFDQDIAELCNLYQVPYLPGCMTVTEMTAALRSGVDIIKLFPSNHFEPGFINAIKAPLPQVNIMPTGGINLDNIEQWVTAGSVAVGVGGSLFAPAKHGNYTKVTQIAKEYIDKFNEIKMVCQ
ncbi:2-dehydro-3-deoxy-phosphogluconate aldolase [Neobacillus kokaensis]|uniref:2-dehydro-3-deoxy-phosphogluconate aldolase n=1 Tax=Neobacillus kokaensis TaxID=2759023 RepID=A0ABQ3N7S4_9BACI|nr:2-dehydro-3-deoxy-phosphogluconate aldolase [Neobacillus kokaensis]